MLCRMSAYKQGCVCRHDVLQCNFQFGDSQINEKIKNKERKKLVSTLLISSPSNCQKPVEYCIICNAEALLSNHRSNTLDTRLHNFGTHNVASLSGSWLAYRLKQEY